MVWTSKPPGFAEVARVAAEMYRPHLATLLLNHEPRSHAQVQVLVQLSREGDEFLSWINLSVLEVEDVQTAWPCFRLKHCKCVSRFLFLHFLHMSYLNPPSQEGSRYHATFGLGQSCTQLGSRSHAFSALCCLFR